MGPPGESAEQQGCWSDRRHWDGRLGAAPQPPVPPRERHGGGAGAGRRHSRAGAAGAGGGGGGPSCLRAGVPAHPEGFKIHL